ncbi:tRNA-dihydrouridine synthase [bacterium]|jgi:tRNA-dihydrouridine synthase B|nr:tRNA-dihydrouridine synthase [bacterium]MBT4649051.1 tRNA-dihydrouridine synthase [bacterium]
MKNFWQQLEKPIISMTPMAGITDSAWRQICKMWGADIVHTEFVSADALHYDSKKTLKMLKYKTSEHPIVVQLFGRRPEMYPKAAKIVESLGVDGIDLNFGCPAKKVAGHGGGICLLRDMDTVKKIVATTIESTKLPVSVKTRMSLNAVQGDPKQGKITVFDFIDALAEFPLAALIVHGRTYETPYTGPVDLKGLKKARKKFKNGIFLINGSFQTVESIVKDLKYTKADGIALSRALYGQPWLFKQIKDYIETGKYKEISDQEIKDTAIKHAHLLWESKGANGFKEMRKHLLFYVKARPDAASLRKQLVAVENPQQVEKIFNKI